MPELGRGAADYDVVEVADERTFAVVRILEVPTTFVLVYLSPAPIQTSCRLKTIDGFPATNAYGIHDAWTDVVLQDSSGYLWQDDGLRQFAATFEPWQSRVLTIQPVLGAS